MIQYLMRIIILSIGLPLDEYNNILLIRVTNLLEIYLKH